MSVKIVDEYTHRIQTSLARIRNEETIRSIAQKVAREAPSGNGNRPVIFFNASTRISGLSLNAAFSLISAWSLQMAGVPVIHFVCQRGMSRCVLGTNRDKVQMDLPCDKCIHHSQVEYADANVVWFHYQEEDSLKSMLTGVSVDAMMRLTYQDIPIGELVLPSLRWELRRYHLRDDESTRFLYREFILSAWSVGREFFNLTYQIKPQAVVLFNGQFFPEAMARYIAQKEGIRVVTHEVGMMPFTAFFTEGEATAYPMEIPPHFELDAAGNRQLDEYLSNRFTGNFKMAGVQFWKSIRSLDDHVLEKMSEFKQMVPIFTNVIFDTSQPHSNTLFPEMFTWMDQVLPVIKAHPETLFVIRAHPDELRPASAKQSRETVRDWVQRTGVGNLANVLFVDATEYISSYDLIRRSKFVMVYNSSIGLEASILGLPVLAAGQSRYTHYPTVFFPESAEAYFQQLEQMLSYATIDLPESYPKEARRVLYYQLFRTAIPFGAYIEEADRPGLVRIKKFNPEDLLTKNSSTAQVIVDGVIHGYPFLMERK